MRTLELEDGFLLCMSRPLGVLRWWRRCGVERSFGELIYRRRTPIVNRRILSELGFLELHCHLRSSAEWN